MKFFTLFIVFFIVQISAYAKSLARQISELNISEDHLRTECAVEKVYVAYSNDVTAVSWTPVNSSCPSRVYKVQYKINDNITEISDSITPATPMALLPLGKLGCERISVKVLVMENNSVVGESNEKELKRGLDDITGLYAEQAIDGIHVMWKPLNLGKLCDVTYAIEYTVGETGQKQDDLKSPEFLIPLVNHTPCTSYEVKVLATSNQMTSKYAEINYEIGIPAVRDVVLTNREGKVVVDFKPSINIPEECGEVDYRVIQNDRVCFRSDVLIVPVSSKGTEGVATQKSITRQPGAVQELEALPKDDKIYLNWQAPVGGAECNMIYFVTFNGKKVGVHSTNFVAAQELEACNVYVLQIAPAIVVEHEHVEGQSTYVELVGELGTVEAINCTLKESVVICEWNKPIKSDSCQKITYEITYFDGTGKKSSKTADTSFSFGITDKLCNFWFNIHPLAYVDEKTWEGDVIGAIIEGCEENVIEIQEVK